MNSKIFFKLLPVQIMIVAMGSINSVVDGVIAGRFINAASVGVIGLFFVMVNMISAISSVFLGGSSVLCGRYMGMGDIDKTRGIVSLNQTVITLIGAVLTVICAFFSGLIADLCGASPELRGELKLYIIGFSIGIIPQLLGAQVAAFLQLERQSLRNYIGVAAMIVSNVVFNITFVVVFNLGIFGLALSTSMCNWIYFIILETYYLSPKAQLRYDIKNIYWEKTLELIKIGFPGALLVFCLALREIVLNRVVITYAGQDGLSAKSSLGMIGGFFIALCLGGGAVIRMLASVNVGEEDRDSIKDLIKLSFTKVLIMSVVIAAIVVMISGMVVSIFFADTTSNVYHLAHQFFVIYGLSIPLIMVVQIETNYLQAMGQNICVNIFSLIDGLFSVIIPAIILAPVLGALGIWLATPIGIVISAVVYPIYAMIFWKRVPRNSDEWLLFKDDFGVPDEDRLVLRIKDKDDVSTTSQKVQEFCTGKGFDKKKAYYSALCLEEMTRNVVEHGFSMDAKAHFLEARVVKKGGTIILRIKDDCKSFDPVDMAGHLNSEDITKNIGIRMVMKLASSANYQNLLGLNVLTIEIA
ncbi:Na+-driven multidrug efflux pump [Butyrivibrio fibrisolvens DSM 3071]|uniref:Na+-driven multidrug efflux pump n=1 Tax=Butyrivibrio fibrisolvens DSM 3071 TaxID=1121131 RepID=A0A1M6BJG9_BUTFI|nr:MATE family efflux transporter [Butyrivibrio fibrisolvens]SHI48930.1 Na+-driven multidrug efflux pump [Butyrivibrio fibrisolvens DSM 3071]